MYQNYPNGYCNGDNGQMEDGIGCGQDNRKRCCCYNSCCPRPQPCGPTGPTGPRGYPGPQGPTKAF